jgi:hypothetical protein
MQIRDMKTEIKSMEENKTDLTQIIWEMRDREQGEGATEGDGAKAKKHGAGA